MSVRVPGQSNRSGVGRVISFWMRYDLISKLARLAAGRGVTRNKMLTMLIEEAHED